LQCILPRASRPRTTARSYQLHQHRTGCVRPPTIISGKMTAPRTLPPTFSSRMSIPLGSSASAARNSRALSHSTMVKAKTSKPETSRPPVFCIGPARPRCPRSAGRASSNLPPSTLTRGGPVPPLRNKCLASLWRTIFRQPDRRKARQAMHAQGRLSHRAMPGSSGPRSSRPGRPAVAAQPNMQKAISPA